MLICANNMHLNVNKDNILIIIKTKPKDFEVTPVRKHNHILRKL